MLKNLLENGFIHIHYALNISEIELFEFLDGRISKGFIDQFRSKIFYFENFINKFDRFQCM